MQSGRAIPISFTARTMDGPVAIFLEVSCGGRRGGKDGLPAVQGLQAD
mgnify:CR=1 FL=1